MIDPEAALLMADSRFARGREFSAPLADATAGRIEVPKGAAWLAISGNAPADLLFAARFGGPIADVETAGSTIRIVYQKFTASRPVRQEARLALNASIPWSLAFSGGLARVRVDLHAAKVGGVSIRGGVSQFEIALPCPEGMVSIAIAGGMLQVTVKRPAEVPVRLRVSGGATKVALDDQRLQAVAGELVLASSHFDTSTAGYDVQASGGVAGLRIVPI